MVAEHRLATPSGPDKVEHFGVGRTFRDEIADKDDPICRPYLNLLQKRPELKIAAVYVTNNYSSIHAITYRGRPLQLYYETMKKAVLEDP